MKKIERCKYDKALNVISAYQPVPFEPKYGDGGYAIRIIEIYRLFKMERSLAELETLTGYNMPSYMCDPDEINFLIERGTAICEAAQEAVNEAHQGVLRYGGEADNPNHNVLDTRQGLVSMKEALRQLQVQRQRAEDNHEKAKLIYQARQGLLGLLRPVVEAMLKKNIKGFMNKVMEKLPVASLPAYSYRMDSYSNGLSSQSHIYAWSKMDELQKAVEEILKHCRHPIDKYELNRNGIAKAELCRLYYGHEGELFRQLMPVNDYVELMIETVNAEQDKNRMMRDTL
ncbi:hypothetical protein H2Y56_12675 [Pectobacterium aroidearum]|uniref:Uncharacterized protein n=1 Tax=Pectobacterium aroidearum TaxID=1201031 RepID=A0ABR5ZEF0_9GAMM|nr:MULTISPECIES: hypothetical protein [Pectobacterium]MBA5200044.1 hypothetical protein [Pectobacterium aroidearum]MBA5228596.1 hypothetical protein [Pectobacterium aroidearum]MBA5232956.1 hypothetical protein [Pectobacterium aroidearum]MBA5738118.1 hypothetical protein [Pectobacterium aroidearum]UXK01055.1 hypothetical protein N5056_03445 [Pectobacterium aroidearum]